MQIYIPDHFSYGKTKEFLICIQDYKPPKFSYFAKLMKFPYYAQKIVNTCTKVYKTP